MNTSYKPGGGNKPQKYITKGQGEKSGEYTDQDKNLSNEKSSPPKLTHFLPNKINKFNFLNSSLVGKVDVCCSYTTGFDAPTIYRPNSVAKKIIDGYVVTERYYNGKGEAYLDIDYTHHGNPAKHPVVPHIHLWNKNEKGEFIRTEWRNFK